MKVYKVGDEIFHYCPWDMHEATMYSFIGEVIEDGRDGDYRTHEGYVIEARDIIFEMYELKDLVGVMAEL